MNVLEPYEHDTQASFVHWCEWNEAARPELAMFFAIANGGDRRKGVAGRLKAEGVKSGVPDMCLPVKRRGFIGLWLEFKRRGSGQLSPEQRDWLERLAYHGHCPVVVWTVEQAVDITCAYLDGALKAETLECPLDMATARLAA